MASRKTLLHVAAKSLMLFGALFVVTVLIAAIPAHRPPAMPESPEGQQAAGAAQSSAQSMPGMKLKGMKASKRHAASKLTPGHDGHLVTGDR